jgi:hypothetical protein
MFEEKSEIITITAIKRQMDCESICFISCAARTSSNVPIIPGRDARFFPLLVSPPYTMNQYCPHGKIYALG